MVVTTDAKEQIVSFLAGNSVTAPTHIAMGTGTSAGNTENTALDTENVRLTFSETTIKGTEVSYTAILKATQGSGVTYSEFGLLNASSSGTLFQRTTFANITKTTNFEIQVTVTLRLD